MIGFLSFVFSLALVFITAVLQQVTGLPLVTGMVAVTAAWAAWDSTQVRVRDYKSGMALHPAGVFLGIALLWIVGFPWYLAVRYRIKRGLQERNPSTVTA